MPLLEAFNLPNGLIRRLIEFGADHLEFSIWLDIVRYTVPTITIRFSLKLLGPILNL